jgi:hypothetical protein
LRETDQKAQIPTHIPPAVRLKPLFNHLKSLKRHPKTKTANATRPHEPSSARNGAKNLPK